MMGIAYRYSRLAERRLARAHLTELQGGLCAGCFETPPKLNLDHDHKTDFVRGLLCHACNVGEGRGHALSWQMYVTDPPAIFFGRPEAMLEHWIASAASAVAASYEAAERDSAGSWRTPMWMLAKGVVDDLERKGSHYSPTVRRWETEEHAVYLAAKAAVREAVSIDTAALEPFAMDKTCYLVLFQKLTEQVANPKIQQLRKERDEMMTDLLASRTPPHAFVDEGPANPDDFPTVHEYYCGYEGCGIVQDRHPQFVAVTPLMQRGSRARQRLAELTALAAA